MSILRNENLEATNPTKAFEARHLEAKLHERSRAISKAAGVKDGALLDAATLDVAVIGDQKAAHAFVGMPAPVAVGEIVADK